MLLPRPNCLTIAGSDPSGGAGIQADLKTFAALRVYGMAVITALTAQNTQKVTGIYPLPPNFVAMQIDTLFEDIHVDAVKTGMMSEVEVVKIVSKQLERYQPTRLVVDPVMVATSGRSLLSPKAVAAMREQLLPLALVLTPNIKEAGLLLGRPSPLTLEERQQAAFDLKLLGPRFVLIKGGHLGGTKSPDLLFNGEIFIEFPGKRVTTGSTHGTGCTLSSAITALLPQRGDDIVTVVTEAKAFVTTAMLTASQLEVGQGHRPLNHSPYHIAEN